jgi:DNA-binding NarL/FixJ family response regulator
MPHVVNHVGKVARLAEIPALETIRSTETQFRGEPVWRAEELKPELILLDIGLPTLNGIDAARQIRRRAPESEIIFLSQESSPDVVQEALSSGARGYVLKTRAGIDLLLWKQFLRAGRLSVADCWKQRTRKPTDHFWHSESIRQY